MNETDDIRIAVINLGPYEPTWFYDHKAYFYPISPEGGKQRITVVPYHVAYFHWAVELDQHDQLVRAVTVRGDDDESWFADRLGSLCPKEFVTPNIGQPGHYTDNKLWIDWYTNRVKFKMKRIPQTMSMEEFAKV
jgi:hypothetical protein